MPSPRILIALVLVFVPMAAEFVVSRVHEERLWRRGAREAKDDNFGALTVGYVGSFLVMALEGAWRAHPIDTGFAFGALTWLVSKLLTYWAIVSLGDRWCFRVLVPPRNQLVATGPYRFLRHPNYVAVVGELVAQAFLCHAPLAGFLSLGGVGWLLRRRIRVEERALGLLDARMSAGSARPISRE